MADTAINIGRDHPPIDGSCALLVNLMSEYSEPEAVAKRPRSFSSFPSIFMFFTGSTSTGKVVARASAEDLTPVLLELGGQNPALVDETANTPDAANKIVWGAIAWGGQWCTSPGYAYVHESVGEAFVAEAKAALIALYGKDPKANPDYSRIIGAREVSRLARPDRPGEGRYRRPDPAALSIRRSSIR